jgi:WhiB family transcriptional regulator, redox-sensing transcriptional regulator
MSETITPEITRWLMSPGRGEQLPSLGDLLGRPLWMDDGACRDTPVDVFFPPKGVDMVAAMARAREVCDQCPVRQQCLEYAVSDPEIEGVWGGTSAKGRAQLRREKRGASRAA